MRIFTGTIIVLSVLALVAGFTLTVRHQVLPWLHKPALCQALAPGVSRENYCGGYRDD